MRKKKPQLEKAVNEICCAECKGENRWCLLKEVIISSHDDEYVRFLKQLKCLEIFKYHESEKAGKDIGWEQAWLSWVDVGHAKKFGDMYAPEMDAVSLYYKIIGKSK